MNFVKLDFITLDNGNFHKRAPGEGGPGTAWDKLESGLPNKDYIPDKYQLVELNEQPYYKFNDITEIKFWLSNMSGNDVIHNIIVHFAFSKIEQQD